MTFGLRRLGRGLGAARRSLQLHHQLCKVETLKAAGGFVKAAGGFFKYTHGTRFGTIADVPKNPRCSKHPETALICPRCIAARGGKKTAKKHKAKLSKWGKQGGRGRKKP
jgi:hypothetical protein